MIAKRQSLSTAEQAEASNAIVQQILAKPFFSSISSVAAYQASHGEITPQAFISHCQQHDIHTALPVIQSFKEAEMAFYTVDNETSFVVNRYGISEPAISADSTPLTAFDVMLIPLVAFDETGARIGMGKGFYDRYLANYSKKTTRPRFIGLAYEFQKVDKLQQSATDICLDEVITDKTWYVCQ